MVLRAGLARTGCWEFVRHLFYLKRPAGWGFKQTNFVSRHFACENQVICRDLPQITKSRAIHSAAPVRCSCGMAPAWSIATVGGSCWLLLLASSSSERHNDNMFLWQSCCGETGAAWVPLHPRFRWCWIQIVMWCSCSLTVVSDGDPFCALHCCSCLILHWWILSCCHIFPTRLACFLWACLLLWQRTHITDVVCWHQPMMGITQTTEDCVSSPKTERSNVALPKIIKPQHEIDAGCCSPHDIACSHSQFMEKFAFETKLDSNVGKKEASLISLPHFNHHFCM